MDRAMILRHLALAVDHVKAGAEAIAKQEALIAELDRGGLDTSEARRLLKNFRELQGLHQKDQARLMDELRNNLGGSSGPAK